jgi:hypothetical protein
LHSNSPAFPVCVQGWKRNSGCLTWAPFALERTFPFVRREAPTKSLHQTYLKTLVSYLQKEIVYIEVKHKVNSREGCGDADGQLTYRQMEHKHRFLAGGRFCLGI